MKALYADREEPTLMSFILVVSRNASCRRLYVDNLVRRGYVAVGVASALETENLLNNVMPDLVLICCMPTAYEPDVERFRTTLGLANTPIVLISQDGADPAWLSQWNVSMYATDLMDLRQLVEILRPWLPVTPQARQRSTAAK